MAHLDLDQEETEVLIEVLETALGDLRHEIADTDHSEFKEGLKARKAVLVRVLEATKALKVSA